MMADVSISQICSNKLWNLGSVKKYLYKHADVHSELLSFQNLFF